MFRPILCHMIRWILEVTAHLNADDFIFAGIEIKLIEFTEKRRQKWKLHFDAGIDRADVLIETVSVQYESQVDVGTSTSIWREVDSDSWSMCVVDRSRLILIQLLTQVVR